MNIAPTLQPRRDWAEDSAMNAPHPAAHPIMAMQIGDVTAQWFEAKAAELEALPVSLNAAAE